MNRPSVLPPLPESYVAAQRERARTEQRALLARTAAGAREPVSTLASALLAAQAEIEGLRARVAVLEERSR